jgi:hypothetical protein
VPAREMAGIRAHAGPFHLFSGRRHRVPHRCWNRTQPFTQLKYEWSHLKLLKHHLGTKLSSPLLWECSFTARRTSLQTFRSLTSANHANRSSRRQNDEQTDLHLANLTCATGTLLDSSLMRSLALMMINGSYVFLVVETVIDPSTRLSSQAMPCSLRALVTSGHTSRRYFSAAVKEVRRRPDLFFPTCAVCSN